MTADESEPSPKPNVPRHPDPEERAAAVRAAGDRTTMQYQEWMQINGASHLIRTARESGITGCLKQRQHTLEQLCETLSLNRQTTLLLLDGLVAIGFVEQYQDDYALARAGHLLSQYDQDLGDRRWETLGDRMKQIDSPKFGLAEYRSQLAATQWIHTAAAMQAAEILDIGGESSVSGPRILDLGCGSAVWSCALAHRDAESTVVAVDLKSQIEAARTMAESIDLSDRFKTIESDPRQVDLGDAKFDLVVLPQLLSSFSDDEAADLVSLASSAVDGGGRVAAPDLYAGPGKAGLKEALARLTVHLSTPAGRVRDLPESQRMFVGAGLASVQFTYLAASEAGLGMIVAQKPS